MSWRGITIIVINVTVALLIAYDVVAVIQGGVNSTISVVLYQYGRAYPIIPFALGVVFGHIFFPVKPADPRDDEQG